MLLFVLFFFKYCIAIKKKKEGKKEKKKLASITVIAEIKDSGSSPDLSIFVIRMELQTDKNMKYLL